MKQCSNCENFTYLTPAGLEQALENPRVCLKIKERIRTYGIHCLKCGFINPNEDLLTEFQKMSLELKYTPKGDIILPNDIGVDNGKVVYIKDPPAYVSGEPMRIYQVTKNTSLELD